ncbi:MAG: hypothetical protein LBV34_16605, partial [Nocardiopsaceae bacterium]|nr:hypothetical protein [Nocardiopsaceae bacterium]
MARSGDPAVTAPWAGSRQAGRHAWADRNAAGADELGSARPVGMTSLRFAASALRRRAWLGCAVVAAGLAITAAVFVFAPPPHQASISILITNDPASDPIKQMQENVALAEKARVAADAVKLLGLRDRPDSFMHKYTVASATDRILVFTTNASSDAEAVRQARALATAFQQYRAQVLHISQRIQMAMYAAQIAETQKNIKNLQRQFITASSRDKKYLRKRLNSVFNTVGGYKLTRNSYPVLTTSMIQGTTILDPAAPIPPSRKHLAAIYGAAGLVASLAAGLGVVIVGAVTSNRLRRRDDVARTLGAPVRLSVGKVRSPWPSGRRARLTDGNTHQRRIVAHLRRTVANGGSALAVVPVDNASAVASS